MNNDVIKSDQIPKPDLFTGRVQPPPDIEVIDESLIIADFVYGGSNSDVTNTDVTTTPTKTADVSKKEGKKK